MNVEAIKSELATLHDRAITVQRDMKRLGSQRAELSQPVPNDGSRAAREAETERRRVEVAKLTRSIDELTREARTINERSTVLRERLEVAKREPPKNVTADLESELAAVRDKYTNTETAIANLKEQIAARALAVTRGDREAIDETMRLDGDRLECERDLGIFAAAIKEIEAKITEAKREFAERRADDARKMAKKLMAELVEDALVFDRAAREMAAACGRMKKARAAIMSTGALPSAQGNALASPDAIERALAAAGLGEFCRLSASGRVPLEQAVRSVAQFIRRPPAEAA